MGGARKKGWGVKKMGAQSSFTDRPRSVRGASVPPSRSLLV